MALPQKYSAHYTYSIYQAMDTHVSPRTTVKVSLFIAEDESYADTTLSEVISLALKRK
ncbi:hypothetical protein [Pseudomonas caricapapayae]|uniref:hypothetical protein n=1 Tax=Pseudomonas caricapapayae TaxID=46678 RepID=UPI0013520E2A|nr:hypothetical protein [Pseudomonas caricapapayae]